MYNIQPFSLYMEHFYGFVKVYSLSEKRWKKVENVIFNQLNEVQKIQLFFYWIKRKKRDLILFLVFYLVKGWWRNEGKKIRG